MPKIGHHTMYFWSAKEKAQNNTERHRVFQKQLYLMYKDNTNYSHMSKKEWNEKLAEFKAKNFDLLNKKEEG